MESHEALPTGKAGQGIWAQNSVCKGTEEGTARRSPTESVASRQGNDAARVTSQGLGTPVSTIPCAMGKLRLRESWDLLNITQPVNGRAGT